MDAKAKIEADQQKYKEDREFKNTLLGIVSGLLGILMIIPAGIYGLFGREPKIDYHQIMNTIYRLIHHLLK